MVVRTVHSLQLCRSNCLRQLYSFLWPIYLFAISFLIADVIKPYFVGKRVYYNVCVLVRTIALGYIIPMQYGLCYLVIKCSCFCFFPYFIVIESTKLRATKFIIIYSVVWISEIYKIAFELITLYDPYSVEPNVDR